MRKNFYSHYNLLFKSTFAVFTVITFFRFTEQFRGPDIHNAFHAAADQFYKMPMALNYWINIILAVIFMGMYVFPLHAFSIMCMFKFNCSPLLRKKSIKLINWMEVAVILIVFSANVLSYFVSAAVSGHSVSFGYARMEISGILASSFLISILVILIFYNIFFETKKMLGLEYSALKLIRIPYQMKFTVMIMVVVCFLFYQIFDVSLQFVKMGMIIGHSGNYRDLVVNNKMLFSQLRNIPDINHAFHVIFVRMMLFSGYIIFTLVYFRKLLSSQIAIARESLTGLNNETLDLSHHLDIFYNDEFGDIFTEINKLIDRQRGKLNLSNLRFLSIISNAADPIITFNSKGTIDIFNPAAETVFGWKRKDAEGKNLGILVGRDGDGGHLLSPEGGFKTEILEESLSVFRFIGSASDGRKIHVEATISRVQEDDSLLFIAIMRDISRQIEFEDSLQEAKTAAENANRMKSEFLANMSHELRTPLNAILGFTQLLLPDRNLTQQQKNNISTISRSGEHLLALINDILDISKIEAGKFETSETVFDLYELIDDMKNMFSIRCAERKLSFYVEITDDLPRYVRGDLGKLRQILINIIGNAVKFTDDGGVSILAGGADENSIRFSVTDTGKGIPEENLENILKPFVQTSETDYEGGTGLGLAISSRFIELLGGRLEIRSEVGKGSEFLFILPFSASESAPASGNREVKRVTGIRNAKNNKVLIVDDKENNRLVLKLMLEKTGFITMEAENGKAAVERAEEFKPGIILMDIRMPVMDGYEAVREIRKKYGTDLKVFALTASAFNHDRDKIFESGFDGFLGKPFRENDLFKMFTESAEIEFIYDESISAEGFTGVNPSDIDFAAVKANLPIGFPEKLNDAVLINDFSAVIELSDSISEIPSLKMFAETIRYLAGNFREKELAEILDRLKRDEN